MKWIKYNTKGYKKDYTNYVDLEKVTYITIDKYYEKIGVFFDGTYIKSFTTEESAIQWIEKLLGGNLNV